MWCVYANLQFRHRTAESIVNSAGHLRDFFAENHMLRGIFEEMSANGFPDEVVTAIRDSLDCNPVFRGHVVNVDQMIFIMVTSIVILGILYLVIASKGESR